MRLRVSFAAILFVLVQGCASDSEPEPTDFTALEPVKEMGHSVEGPWTPLDGGITNMVPSDVPVKDGQVRDGSGVSTALQRGFNARDVDLEATVIFDGVGAPSLVFRATENDGVVNNMYSVALYREGINIWRMVEGRWVLLEARAVPLQPRTAYSLRVTADKVRILVFLNGERASELLDDSHLKEGRAGIRAIEGPCKISGLRISKL
ncbi:MAG TPA: hypothetical protein PLJ47_13215 [Candidatus Hydrogenedentes bacterium]|nr:hypothetical protein [Candidatus Hydrogenedentota bacterium]